MSEQYDGNMMAQTIIRLRDQVAKLKAERDRAHRACEQISVRLHAAQTERDALKADAVSYGQWQPIETAPNMQKIIVHYLNALGNGRCVMACYYPAGSLEMHDDYYYASVEDDDCYAPEGWYEEHEQELPLRPVAEEPTHWMPLPAPPNKVQQIDAARGET